VRRLVDGGYARVGGRIVGRWHAAVGVRLATASRTPDNASVARE